MNYGYDYLEGVMVACISVRSRVECVPYKYSDGAGVGVGMRVWLESWGSG